MSEHHQPSLAAVREVFPAAAPVRTGGHRARGETTKAVERSHLPPRARRRAARGLKTLATGRRGFDGFAARYALRHGHRRLEPVVPGYPPSGAPPPQRARALVDAWHTLGARLTRAA